MLLKKLFRTALKYKAQFISMIIMVAIGTGVFIGFNIEWKSLEENINLFFEETHYADYRIISEEGFSLEDVNNVKAIEGIDAATRFCSINVSLKNSDASIALTTIEEDTVSSFITLEGDSYTGQEGVWLSDKFAKQNNLKLGSEITFLFQGYELSSIVVGFVKSGEYLICVSDENQIMPDYRSHGFAYISPNTFQEKLGFIYYPQIHISSDLSQTEVEEKLFDVFGKNFLTIEKQNHVSYAAALSEIEEGKTMGSILPVLFLAIGLLTMMTTMHRITINEKTQIGIMKALGIKNKKIIKHYTSYGFMIGLIGSVFGIGIGYGIAAIVLNPTGMMGTYFDMPYWSLYIPWFCYLAFIVCVIFLTFISYLSVRKMLKGTTAEVLRPYVPKKVKPFILEKTKIWSRFSFGTKWNLRDMTRHKSRIFMTLLGVMGCMILLVGGLGMKDTMTSYLDVIEETIYQYHSRINVSNEANQEELEQVILQSNADVLSSLAIEYNQKAISLEIYRIDQEDPKICFIDEDNHKVSLSDDGVYLCLRLADEVSIGDRITISLYGSSLSYEVSVAGFIRSVLTESIVMTETYADSLSLQYQPTALFVDFSPEELNEMFQDSSVISSIQTKESILLSYDSFLEIMNVMILVLVIAAIILGVVVLYNLGVMSYIERYKELATLKVLGFKNRYIGNLLISQNLWLSILGILLGLPLGYFVLKILLLKLASEYELKLVLGPLTYILSIGITFGVSLLVSFLIIIKNKKINMVESLKMEE